MGRRIGSKAKVVTDKIVTGADGIPRRSDGTFLPGRDSAKDVRFVFEGDAMAEAKNIFLAELDKAFNQTKALRSAGISKFLMYKWCREDAEFARARREIIDGHLDNVQENLYTKAMSSGKESVLAGTILMNAWRPKRYKAKGNEGASGNVTFQLVIGKQQDQKQLSDGKEITVEAREV